jgi:hypothetical protein
MEPIGLNVPVGGSYTSALLTGFPTSFAPPATRTPPGREAAAGAQRLVPIDPVGLNEPDAAPLAAGGASKPTNSKPTNEAAPLREPRSIARI